MKKLLVIFAILCAVLNGSAFNASRATTIKGTFGAFLRQWNSEAFTYWAMYEISGSDITYTVYGYSVVNDEYYEDEEDEDEEINNNREDRMFEIEKKFTLHNVISENSYPVGIKLIGTSQEVIVSAGFFETIEEGPDPFCVTIYDNGKYLVYNDEGNMIGELPLNEKGEVGAFMLSVICDGNALYVTNDKESGSYTTWVFAQGSGVKEIGASGNKAKAYPNPLTEGQTVTVELPYPADQNTLVVVSDLNGRQMVKKNIKAGQNEVQISANLLSDGMNIYTLIYSDGKSYSGKLIKE